MLITHTWSRSVCAFWVVLACIVLTACEAAPTQAPSGTANGPTGFPVRVENCGRQLTFDRPPSRVYVGYQTVAEMFVGLGLADHAISRRKLVQPPPPDQADAFNRIPENPADKLPGNEALLSLHADFLLAYVEFGKGGSASGRITVDDLATAGTTVYQAICPDSPHAAGTQEDIYRILRDLGTIFGVADRAAHRIEAMHQRIADVQAKIAGRPPVKVLFYGEGEGPLITVGSAALADEVIKLAGGTNVFHDSIDGYFEASLESVTATSPDVFYVNSRSSGAPLDAPDDGQAQADYLYKTFPNMPASRDRRAAFTTYLENEPGWRFADAVENLARVLHPDAFK